VFNISDVQDRILALLVQLFSVRKRLQRDSAEVVRHPATAVTYVMGTSSSRLKCHFSSTFGKLQWLHRHSYFRRAKESLSSWAARGMFSTLLIAKSGQSAQLANVHVGNDNDYSVIIPASVCSVI
jgi:hypothetical protein